MDCGAVSRPVWVGDGEDVFAAHVEAEVTSAGDRDTGDARASDRRGRIATDYAGLRCRRGAHEGIRRSAGGLR